MAKRNANTELNHDNWNEEEEPQEAGVFVQADNKTMEGRVIKKAKRRGIKNDGGPSLFAGFAGFGKTTSGAAPEPEAAASFDFLKKPSNGSENGGKSDSAASFDFATPASQTPSLFAFGSANSSQKDSNSATFSFGNGSAKDTSNNSGAASTFTFGSAASKVSKPESTFSFGKTTENNDTTSKKSKDSDKIEPAGFTGFGTAASLEKKEDAPTKPAPAINPLPIISNPIVMPKSNKWSCSICMIQNDPDKDACACCAEPKPGSKPKVAEPVKPALGGVITSSGFKFGSSTPSSAVSAPSSGFIFGSKNNSESSNSNSNSAQTSNVVEVVKKPDEYSKEFLAHLKALNVQVSAWIKTHIEKNPYVFLSPVFRDYEKHIKDIEEKFKNTKSSEEVPSTKEKETTASKPLLGAVFGSSSADSTPKTSDEPVKFGTGTGFAFGSAAKTNTVESGEKSGFSFGSSTADNQSTKSGFSFGSAAPAKTESESKPSEEKSEDKNKAEDKKPPSGFFGSGSSDTTTKTTTGFTFGSAAEKTPSTGFTFGSKSEDSTNSSTAPSGFSFGTGNSNAGSGFPGFGSNGSNDAGGKTGFTFGSAPSTGFTGFGSAASLEKKEEAPAAAADAEDEPPKVEVTQVVEEGAIHSVRCKLYYMKDKAFVEKGLGMLHLKKVEGDDTKTQLVVRAETNLGNILLNILVGDKMKVTVKKNNVQFMCVPNPPIKGMEGPVMMLAKVKDSLMAEQLEAKLEEVTKTTTT